MPGSVIRKLSYPSWARFKSEYFTDVFGQPHFRDRRFIFRGQGHSDWLLAASFDRWWDTIGDKLTRPEGADALLKVFLEEIEGTEWGDLSEKDEVMALALAQQHGVPTRLLDWSRSPYVAAFFAFVERLQLGEIGGHVAVWALDLNAGCWKKEVGVEIVRAPIRGNIRLRNQSGMFTILRTPHRCLEEYVEAIGTMDGALICADLPASEAPVALADLASMGITASRLFPGLEGAAREAQHRILRRVFGGDPIS